MEIALIIVIAVSATLLPAVLVLIAQCICRLIADVFDWSLADWVVEKVNSFRAPVVYGESNALGRVDTYPYAGAGGSFAISDYVNVQESLHEEGKPFYCNPYKKGLRKNLYDWSYRRTVREQNQEQQRNEAARKKAKNAQKDMFTAVKENRKTFLKK